MSQPPPQPPFADEERADAVIVGDPRPALREFVGVVAVFFCLWLVPYLHPALEDYRYLSQLDVSPLVRAVTFAQPPTAEQRALPGGVPSGGDLNEEDEEAALAALDTTVKGGPAPGLRAPPRGPDDGPMSPDHSAAGEPAAAGKKNGAKGTGKGSAQGSAKGSEERAKPGKEPPARRGKGGALPPALQISDETIGKPRVQLEHPERMDVFWRALVDLAMGRRKHVRIRHYGDSHLANDGISHVLRVLLQRRFGDGGHGYLLAASRTQWYHRKGVRWASGKSWKPRNFLGGGLSDGAYGYGGVAAIGGSGASFRVRTKKEGVGSKANRFELFWRGVASGAMQVRIDGKTEVIRLAGDGRDTFRAWDLPDGAHDIRVRVVRGRARIFGAAFERTTGVTYDSLGIVGARARRWLNANAQHMVTQLTHRPGQLVVFNYGGNSRNDRITESRYLDRYVKVIKRLRLGEREACLIIGPTDHGKKKRGKIISEPNTARMVKWQRKLADLAGCAFLDARALMGGDGSMGRWVKQGLGWADYGHLTPKGQRTLGKAIYGTWMAGLRGYLAKHNR